MFEKTGDITDEENDMLDLAFGLTETYKFFFLNKNFYKKFYYSSRLGCQIKLKPELDGIELEIPSATRNMAVDGYKPPKH